MSNEKKVINDNIFFTKTVSICKNRNVSRMIVVVKINVLWNYLRM